MVQEMKSNRGFAMRVCVLLLKSISHLTEPKLLANSAIDAVIKQKPGLCIFSWV